MAFPRVRQDYITFGYGLDQTSPAEVSIPGSVLACANMRVVPTGGYKRIDGYERFDGVVVPSSAEFTVVVLDSEPSSDDSTITIVGAAYTVLERYKNEVYVYGGALPVAAGDAVTYAGAQFVVVDVYANNAATAELQTKVKSLAADILRRDVQPIPNIGTLVGAAFTDDGVLVVGGAGAYKTSSSHWSPVTAALQLDFSNATGLVVGATVTGAASGASAQIDAIHYVYGTGDTTSPGKGTALVSGLTGQFQPGEVLQVNGADAAVASTEAQAFYPVTGGNFNSLLYNFTGAAARILYFVDGVSDRVFVCDGRLYSIPLSLDNPLTHITAHAQRLVVSSHTSIMVSSVDDVLQFDAVVGGAEIACGSYVTALVPFRGDSSTPALFIGTSRGVKVLYGSSQSTWRLDNAVNDLGVLPDGAAFVGNDVLFASDSGVFSLRGTMAFGNFSVSRISQAVDPLYQRDIRPNLLRTVVVAENSECRFVCKNGVVLSAVYTTGDDEGYKFSVYDYASDTTPVFDINAVTYDVRGGRTVTAAVHGGYLYRMDSGVSFDGAPVVAFFVTNYITSGGPHTRKRYRRAFLDVVSDGFSELVVSYDVSPDGLDSGVARDTTTTSTETAKFFDVAVWDKFTWSFAGGRAINLDTPGTGVGISLIIKHNSKFSDSFTVRAVTLHFTIGRMERK